MQQESRKQYRIKLIDKAIYALTSALIVIGSLLAIGYLWVPGPELGLLLAVLSVNSVWFLMKGIYHLVNLLKGIKS